MTRATMPHTIAAMASRCRRRRAAAPAARTGDRRRRVRRGRRRQRVDVALAVRRDVGRPVPAVVVAVLEAPRRVGIPAAHVRGL